MQVGKQEILEKRGGLRKRLQAIREEMLPLVGRAVTVEIMESDQPLLRSILNAINDRKPDLLLIGSDGPGDGLAGADSAFGEVGDHVIGIARISPIPVLIVPGGKNFEGIHKVLLPSDFRNLVCLSPLKVMQEDKLWRNRKILVINVDPRFRRTEPDDRFRAVSASLEKYLTVIDHEEHYSDASDTADTPEHFSGARKERGNTRADPEVTGRRHDWALLVE